MNQTIDYKTAWEVIQWMLIPITVYALWLYVKYCEKMKKMGREERRKSFYK